jgi:hypothetical protein
MGFSLTGKEVAFAVVLAVLGFLFSTREWLLFADGLNPLAGLLIYYIVLYVFLIVLSKLGLVILGVKIEDFAQTFGLLLMTFAFFIVVDWSSGYVQWVTMGPNSTVSNIFLQCEDGAVYFVWTRVLPFATQEVWRILTYVVTPFFLALAGGVLSSKKLKF